MLLNIQKNLKIIFKQKDNHYINNKVNLIKRKGLYFSKLI